MTEDLSQEFTTYFEEIDRCLDKGCYWSLVHVLVVLPAVCAATEAPTGDADGNGYMNWCGRYFDNDARFTPRDRYALRTALVHRGRTTADEAGQYRSYSIATPTEQNVHLTVRDFGPDHKNLIIDVGRLASETKRAMERWFGDQRNARRVNIGQNVPLLARQGQAEIATATGITWQVPVMSSTGSIIR